MQAIPYIDSLNSLETSIYNLCNTVVSVDTECNDALAALTDLKNAIYTAIGSSQSDSPRTITAGTADSDYVVGQLQLINTQAEALVILQVGRDNTRFGTPEPVVAARQAFIIALYDLRDAELAAA